jgi:hypothetical protein
VTGCLRRYVNDRSTQTEVSGVGIPPSIESVCVCVCVSVCSWLLLPACMPALGGGYVI